ncbi:MAG TPA: hypothetical protein VEX35_01695 [Allosphingosinicella sp.]|nr:hypothetical protein [Allosphingosinicella sp.]
MKILASLIATCLVATPVFAQGDPAPGADTGKPAAGSEPPAEGEPPADDPAAAAVAAAKPVSTEPEPEEAPEGTTPDKPAEPPEA